MKLLITGITGNTGNAVYQAYQKDLNHPHEIIGGVRKVEKYKEEFKDIELRSLDFLEPSTFDDATKQVDAIFLVRPPQISDYQVLNQFIDVAIKNQVKQIVFLSLMGIEKNPFPPHKKIEQHLLNSQVNYTFLRPSFFMENLMETHLEDIVKSDDLFIPSGMAKLSFIASEDIGLAAKNVLGHSNHYNKAYTLTGSESLNYQEVSHIMTEVLGRKITYSKPGLLKFRRTMLKRGYPKDFVNVMLFLNIMTRLNTASKVTVDLKHLIGQEPITMKEFIQKNRTKFKKE
jgi:uncharacterized protein YbjT (DUF2867 family)